MLPNNSINRMESKQNRNIRIFISSTFSDMQLERNYLIGRVFPRLKQIAEKHNVSITPLDLRWGITEEEAKNGEVLQICLQEIENSHPFFIGIIGNRYGWCPNIEELKRNEVLAERWGDWLERDINSGLSVTEMEMQYGVLRSKEELDAFFFLKNGGIDEKENADKLLRLKDNIRNNGKYPVEDYDTPEQLGEKVENAFVKLLQERFPIGDTGDYEREQIVNEAFINNRIQSYVPNNENIKVIDDFVNDKLKRHLVISGESGCGKSAFLANWIINNRTNENFNIAYHFVGNGVNISSHLQILAKITNSICRLYEVSDYQDTNSDAKEKLNKLLGRISDRKPLVIIIDGINQIIDIDGAKTLNWLPDTFQNVKYIISTTPNDETYKSCLYRQLFLFSFAPLNKGCKTRFIKEYLANYGKNLPADKIDSIANHRLSENMLFLKSLLNELLSVGVYEQLYEILEHYLLSRSIEDFFQKVLERYEKEFTNGKIEKALSLIAFSRSGLQESEIVDMASCTPLEWSQFYCAFRENLINVGGFITYSHHYIIDAVRTRYQNNKISCSKAIIRYFGQEKTNRSKYEILYHMHELGEYDMLYHLLLIPDVFLYHLGNDKFELAKYWKTLMKSDRKKYNYSTYLSDNSDFNIKDYFTTSTKLSEYYYSIGWFFGEFFGDYQFVIDCYARSLLETRNRQTLQNARTYNNIGHIFSLTGKYEEAIRAHKKALNMRLELIGENDILIAQSYGNIGFAYDKLGNYEIAIDCFKKSLEIHLKCNHSNKDAFVSNDYNNIGHVLTNMGQYDEGLEYERKALSIRLLLLGDNNFDTAMSKHNIGAILYLQNNKKEAEPYLKDALNTWISLLGNDHPQVATGKFDLGRLYRDEHQYDLALKLFSESLDTRNKTIGCTHPDTINNYVTLADFCFQLSEYVESRNYYTALNKIITENEQLQSSYYPLYINVTGGVGVTNCKLGNYDEGILFLKKAIEMCESHYPQGQQLLMGLKSNLFEFKIRKKEGLTPDEGLRISVDMKNMKSLNNEQDVEKKDKPEKSLIKRIVEFFKK